MYISPHMKGDGLYREGPIIHFLLAFQYIFHKFPKDMLGTVVDSRYLQSEGEKRGGQTSVFFPAAPAVRLYLNLERLRDISE